MWYLLSGYCEEIRVIKASEILFFYTKRLNITAWYKIIIQISNPIKKIVFQFFWLIKGRIFMINRADRCHLY
jgi:hypothetical protein